MNPRKPIVGGNWKMHLVSEDVRKYAEAVHAGFEPASTDVVVFPPYTLLAQSSELLRKSGVQIGGQNLHTASKGAFTGDISATQLFDAGCTWVLCGHSERRQNHGESSALVGAKAQAAAGQGLLPMICVGETGDERAAGQTDEVLEDQLRHALAGGLEVFELAYEPVWAIGTGETATPEIAQSAHAFLRSVVADILGSQEAERHRILYGGSVNPDNAADLIAQPDIDGFLVGGASLDPEKFLTIIRSCGS